MNRFQSSISQMSLAMASMAAAFAALGPMAPPVHRHVRADSNIPRCHVTKGFRGTGTHDRGANRRRRDPRKEARH